MTVNVIDYQKPDNSFVIGHLSDFHIGLSGYEVCIDKLCNALKITKPDVLVVTGDIVDSPNDTNAKGAKRVVERLGDYCNKNILLVMGNHDRFKKGNRFPWNRRSCSIVQEALSEHTLSRASFVTAGGVRMGFVGIDSANSSKYLAQGFITSDQLQTFELQTREARRECDILVACLHHHPLKIAEVEKGSLEEATLALANSAQFLRVLSRTDVDIVLHGHHHHRRLCWYAEDLRHLSLILGTGSVVGASEIKCNEENACFSLIQVTKDRRYNVFSFQWNRPSNTWEYEEKLVREGNEDIILKEDEAHEILKWLQFELNKLDGCYVIAESTRENGQIASRLYSRVGGEVIGTSFSESPINYLTADYAKTISGGKFTRITKKHLLTKEQEQAIRETFQTYEAKSKLVVLDDDILFSEINGIYSKLHDGSYICFLALDNYEKSGKNKGLVFCGKMARELFEYYDSFIRKLF